MGSLISRFFRQEDFMKELEKLDQKMADVELRLVQFQGRQRFLVRQLIQYTIVGLVIYLVYWKFGLPENPARLEATLYIAVFPAIGLLGFLLESWLDELKTEQQTKLTAFKRKMDFENTAKAVQKFEARLSSLKSPSSTPDKQSAPFSSPSKPAHPKQGPKQPSGVPQPGFGQYNQDQPRQLAQMSQALPQQPQPQTQAQPQQKPQAQPHPSHPQPQHPALPQPQLPTTPAAPPRMPVPEYLMTPTQPRPASPVNPPAPSGWMDKVVDWLIGDSPSSSFALVCEKCKANNGLAPVDEMDGIQFECGRCRHFNSRKKTTSEKKATTPKRTSAPVGADPQPLLNNPSDSPPSAEFSSQGSSESKKDR